MIDWLRRFGWCLTPRAGDRLLFRGREYRFHSRGTRDKVRWVRAVARPSGVVREEEVVCNRAECAWCADGRFRVTGRKEP